MFEKQAEEKYCKGCKSRMEQCLWAWRNTNGLNELKNCSCKEVPNYIRGAIDGYNKAKEEDKWHFVKDGDLPKENEYILIYSKLADNIAVGKRRCAGKIRKRCVYEWYFATYEGTYCLRDKDIIAWKEIVLPELPGGD